MPPWVLVTPSSRGIGLELARRLLRTTQLPVVATARGDLDATRESILQPREYASSPANASEGSGRLLKPEDAETVSKEGDSSRLHVMKVDFLAEDSIASAASDCEALFGKVKGGSKDPADVSTLNHLHLAMAVPGLLHPEKAPSQLDEQQMLETFRLNTIGPLLLLKHFAKFLPKKTTKLPEAKSEGRALGALPRHATWCTMSARVGSIADNELGGWYSYRASKAGVNQMTRTFDNYLKTTSGANAMALALHPGTVRTGLSKEFWGNVKEGKLFSPEFAAKCLVDVVGSRGEAERGRIWDWKGEEIRP